MSYKIGQTPKDGIQSRFIQFFGNSKEEQKNQDEKIGVVESTSLGNEGGNPFLLYKPASNGLENTFLGKEYLFEAPRVSFSQESPVDYRQQMINSLNLNYQEARDRFANGSTFMRMDRHL